MYIRRELFESEQNYCKNLQEPGPHRPYPLALTLTLTLIGTYPPVRTAADSCACARTHSSLTMTIVRTSWCIVIFQTVLWP